MQTWIFPAVIEKLGDDDFLANFPDVPEARTGGASLVEVRENAADALEEAILGYLARGRPIPSPREPRGGEEAIILDPVTAARAALATAIRMKRISNVALAKTLGKKGGSHSASPGRVWRYGKLPK
jgi:predicted RNase H-like HicB family nuclease